MVTSNHGCPIRSLCHFPWKPRLMSNECESCLKIALPASVSSCFCSGAKWSFIHEKFAISHMSKHFHSNKPQKWRIHIKRTLKKVTNVTFWKFVLIISLHMTTVDHFPDKTSSTHYHTIHFIIIFVLFHKIVKSFPLKFTLNLHLTTPSIRFQKITNKRRFRL